MKYILYFFFHLNFFLNAQLFDALAKLPPPAIFQSIPVQPNTSQLFRTLQDPRADFDSRTYPKFLENNNNYNPSPSIPFTPLNSQTIQPQQPSSINNNNIQSSSIPQQITPMMFDRGPNQGSETAHLITEFNNENHGGTPLPDFIKEDIAPKIFNKQPDIEDSISELLKNVGIQIKNKTIFMEPETKIHLNDNSTITMKQLENLINFNINLMRKCGKNLEFCMIKDNILDEEMLSGDTFSNIDNKISGKMKFLEVNEKGRKMNSMNLQNELDDILQENENNNSEFDYNEAQTTQDSDDLDIEASFQL